jgi:DNA-binding XRE family transcriptional regulator
MSTNQLSLERSRQSRNMQSDILHAVAEVKQVNVAKCLDVDSSTVGRWLDSSKPDSQVVRFCDMLAICGLKIVPANAKHYDAAKIEILFRITKDHFQSLNAVDDFFQNDAGTYDSTDARYSRASDLSDVNTNSNIVSELLASFYKACKSLVAPKKYSRELIMLTARPATDQEQYERKARLARQTINECEQEAKDKEADEAAFWKLVYALVHVAAAALVLFTLIYFWSK